MIGARSADFFLPQANRDIHVQCSVCASEKVQAPSGYGTFAILKT